MPIQDSITHTQIHTHTHILTPIHSFIHSLYFPYIHIQVEYQGCGNCHSCCNSIWQGIGWQYVDCIHLAQKRDKWWSFMNMVMNFQVP